MLPLHLNCHQTLKVLKTLMMAVAAVSWGLVLIHTWNKVNCDGTVTVQLEYFSQYDIDQFLKDANINALRTSSYFVFTQAHHLQVL